MVLTPSARLNAILPACLHSTASFVARSVLCRAGFGFYWKCRQGEGEVTAWARRGTARQGAATALMSVSSFCVVVAAWSRSRRRRRAILILEMRRGTAWRCHVFVALEQSGRCWIPCRASALRLMWIRARRAHRVSTCPGSDVIPCVCVCESSASFFFFTPRRPPHRLPLHSLRSPHFPRCLHSWRSRRSFCAAVDVAVGPAPAPQRHHHLPHHRRSPSH